MQGWALASSPVTFSVGMAQLGKYVLPAALNMDRKTMRGKHKRAS